MDPSDLRAGVAEALAKDAPIDAATFNAACFMLSRALDEMGFSVPDAAPLVRKLLRVVGRVVGVDPQLDDRAGDQLDAHLGAQQVRSRYEETTGRRRSRPPAFV